MKKLAQHIVAVVGLTLVGVTFFAPTSADARNGTADVPPACKECMARKVREEGCTATYNGDPAWTTPACLAAVRRFATECKAECAD
jgi:hypothetical protein